MGAGGVRPRPELLLGLAVDLSDPDTWFVSAAPGPRQGHDENRSAEAVIYRWRGTGPWQALSEGLPQSLKSLPAAPATAPGWLLAGFSTGVSMRAGTVERTESNCPSAAMSFPMCRRSQWWIEDDPRFQGRRRDWQQTRLNFPLGQLSQGQPLRSSGVRTAALGRGPVGAEATGCDALEPAHPRLLPRYNVIA
jgi:hypothetical protein